MRRRPYLLLVGNAVLMAVLAIAVSIALGYPLRDPDGFLGPAWTRLPLLCVLGFAVDLVPLTLWRSRGNPARFREVGRARIREHWTKDRVVLVLVGVLSFYAVYVSYRNLKNFLPFVRSDTYDYALHNLDHWLLFGHDPALLLHQALGTGFSAQVLSFVYLFFLPLVPIVPTVWLVWSRNIRAGYWFVTADCVAWSLGTASYYLIPTQGPAFAFEWLYTGLDRTGVTGLQEALFYGRQNVRFHPYADAVQSIAGFASLHVAITLLMVLIAQYALRNRALNRVMWVFLVLVVLSTTYFGWHYIADDLAGVVIALVSVWVGAVAVGVRFGRWGRPGDPEVSELRLDPADEAGDLRVDAVV